MKVSRLLRSQRFAALVLPALLVAVAASASDQMFLATAAGIERIDLGSLVRTTVAPGAQAGGYHGACQPAIGLVYFPTLAGVRRWNQDGSGETAVVVPGAMPVAPYALTFDAAGNLYVLAEDGSVWRVDGGDPANPPQPFLASPDPAAPTWQYPEMGLEVVRGGPHAGALLVVFAAQLYISEPAGTPLRPFGSGATYPGWYRGVASDGCGNLLLGEGILADAVSFGQVQRLDPEGAASSHQALDPNPIGIPFDSVAIDSTGVVYASQLWSGRLWRIARDGSRSLIPGPGTLAICRENDTVPCTETPCVVHPVGPVRGLMLSHYGDRIFFNWTPEPSALEGFNVRYVAQDKRLIPACATCPGSVAVCTPDPRDVLTGLGPSCDQFGALPGAPGEVFFYNVLGICHGIEVPD